MDKLTDILNSIYGKVSDAVVIYSDQHKLIYQNKSSVTLGLENHQSILLEVITSNNIDTISIDSTRKKASYSSLEIIGEKLSVIIVSHTSKAGISIINEQIKSMLSDTATTEQSFYTNIGELIQHELQLDNLQISIHNQKQKALVNQYFSNDLPGLLATESKKKYLSFVTELIATPKQKFFYTEEELNIFSDLAIPSSYLFIPIRSKRNIVGGMGIFVNSKEEAVDHQGSLESIAEYVGIYYTFHHLEETLLQQTSRLNAVFESSSDLVWSIDRTMEIVSFNQNYYRAIFYKYQGGVVTEYFKNGTNITSSYDEFWEAKYEEAFTGDLLHFEIELKHPSNEPVWKEVFLMPIYKDNGTIEEISGIAKDISDKKKTVTALHQEEEKFKQIFESFQDLYIRVDLSGAINMVSPSVTDLIGYTPEEVMGKDVSIYYLYNLRTKDFFKKILQADTLRNIDMRLIGKEGNIIPFICDLRIIKGEDNKPIAIEAICKDITEIKKTNEALISAKENLEISLKAKEQFLANMSHEIRTPMNGIIGLLDMMQDTHLSDKQNKYLSTIKESSGLLLNLLNDILDLSKMNADKLNINKQSLSVHKLLNNINTLFASEIEKNHLNFKIDIDDSVPRYVKSDKMRLLQILSNLVSNAIKFTPKSGSITVNATYQEPFTVKINVVDTGIGIKERDLKKLFQNFTQINNSYSKQYAGTGLGLVISKDLAKLLGGDIGVTSTYQKGSDFWFTFKAIPTDISPLEEPKITISTPTKNKTSESIKSILVVDDNPTNRLVACEILRKLGLITDNVDNAEEAIKIAKDKSYDVILMDIQMPRMDGIEGMKHIKSNNLHQTIIAMTAYDEKNQLGRFEQMGFDGYLAKPITPETLMESIHGIESRDNRNVKETASEAYGFKTIQNLAKYADLDTMSEVFCQFEEGLMIKTSEIKSAYSIKEFDIITSHIHSIKGDAGTLGFGLISTQASKIEKNIDKEYFTSLDEDLKTLYLMLERVPNLIKELLKKLSHEYKNINR